MMSISFMVICSIFAHGIFTDEHILPKWLCAGIFACIAILCPCGNTTKLRNVFFSSYMFSVIVLCTICLIQYTSSHVFDKHSDLFDIYDNTAGVVACICPIVPFAVSKRKILSIICLCLVILTVLCLQSRSGIIAITTSLVTYFLLDHKEYNLSKLILYACITFTLIIAIYAIIYIGKQESAIGRAFIWHVTLSMLYHAPTFGYGWDGFAKHYMDFQAAYFMSNNDLTHGMLADNVKTPFCEYLGLVIDFGIVGILAILIVIVTTLFLYLRSLCAYKNAHLCSIISISTISLFSYPFTYPIVWLIFTHNIVTLYSGCSFHKFTIRENIKNLLTCLKVSSTFLILLLILQRGFYERQWADDNKNGKEYSNEIKDYFQDNTYFIYNCALRAIEEGEYSTALSLLKRCDKSWADYDVTLNIGLLYYANSQYAKALYYLKKAHYMCPNRFIPLHYMAEVYKELNQISDALLISTKIIHMPIKIPSEDIAYIKYTAQQYIKQQTYSSNNQIHSYEKEI